MRTIREQRFTEIYVSHYAEVLGYVLRRSTRDDAQDASSEVFTVVWRRMNDVPTGIETLPWLYGIAARVLANQRRTERRLRELYGRSGEVPVVEHNSMETGGVSTGSMSAALNTLRPEDREILLLYAWEALSAREIAMLFEISSAAAEERLVRARSRLERVLPVQELRSESPTASRSMSQSTQRQGLTVTEQWGAANPVSNVSLFVPTVRDATEFLAVLIEADAAESASLRSASDDLEDDDLRIHFDEMIEEAAPPTAPRRWSGVAAVAALAAAALIVGAVLFVTDGNRDNAATEPPVASPVASPRVAGPVVSLSPDDPVSWMKVKDPVSGYRWSRVPSDFVVFGRVGSTAIQDVIAGGPGVVAVGGAANAIVWTSRDGTTWSRVPDESSVFDDESGGMSSVVDTGSILVAVGGRTKCCDEDGAAMVWTSADGITWSRAPHNETVFDGARMNSVTMGGPGLVAVGNGQRADDEPSKVVVWTSPDGLTWSRVPHDNAAFDGASIESVVSGAFGLVAVGADWDDDRAAVWTSADGLTWSRVRSDETVFGKNTEMKSVTIGGPGLVAVGSDGGSAAVWTSSDGITWSRVPHDEAVFASPDQHEMDDVIAGGPGLIAVGSVLLGEERGGAAVWTSPDGITWSRMPGAEFIFGAAHMRSVAIGGPGLVAVGEIRYGSTIDAAIWVASLE